MSVAVTASQIMSNPYRHETGPPALAGTISVQVEHTDLPKCTPMQLYAGLAAKRSADDVFLLESLDGPDRDRRSAVVGWARLAELRVVGNRLELRAAKPLHRALARVVEAVLSAAPGPLLDETATPDPTATPKWAGTSWRLLDSAELWVALRTVQSAFSVRTDLPEDCFAFGFLTALAYEAAWHMEELSSRSTQPEQVTLAWSLFQHTAWFDLTTSQARQLHATGRDLPPVTAGDAILPLIQPDPGVPDAPAPLSVVDSMTAEQFYEGVGTCLRHIGVGDSYQIQLGHRIDIRSALPPLDAYRRLRHRNPSPYMYLLPFAGRTVIGASPELFIRLERGQISMRPIAGTARRGADPAADLAHAEALRHSVKEQAEHVMLVDLCRNDIGRVCVPGSLAVESMMDVEPFAYVHHLVSTVAGRLDQDVDVWAAIRATFPAGTMTGAPKVRAMEIIDSIEPTPRGIYAGAVGVIDVRGFTMLALCIRTTIHDGEVYSIQASAGVVADSSPEAEWRETLAKLSATYWAITGTDLQP